MAARATRARAPLHGRRPQAPVPEGVPQIAPPPPKAAPRPSPSAVQRPQPLSSALPGVQPAQAPLPRPAPSVARRPAPAPAPRTFPQTFPRAFAKNFPQIFQIPTGIFRASSGISKISRLKISDFPEKIPQFFQQKSPLTGVKPGVLSLPQPQPQPQTQPEKCRCPKPKKAKPRSVCRFGYFSETARKITYRPWGKKSCQPSKSKLRSLPEGRPTSSTDLPTSTLGLAGL